MTVPEVNKNMIPIKDKNGNIISYREETIQEQVMRRFKNSKAIEITQKKDGSIQIKAIPKDDDPVSTETRK